MALTKVNTDLLADGGKLNGIEAGADVTDTTNVTAAGALMDSELTSIASVKALDQGVASTDSPTFAGLTTSGEITANGGIALGDGDELTLGDSDEFKIKHHASGYTHLQNTVGTLYIDSDSVTFRDDDGSPSNMVISQTGIDVTGTATMDGLTVDAAAPFMSFKESGSTKLFIGESSAVGGGAGYYDFYAVTGLGQRFFTNSVERLRIESAGNVTMKGATTTIGSAAASTNVEFNLNGVASKAQRIQFQEGGVSRWLLGQGAASETSAFELYNAGGVMALSVDRTTNAATFGGDIILASTGKLYSSGDTDSYLQFNQPNTLRAIIGDSTRMIIEPNTTVFNDDSADADFRVESDTNTTALYMDASLSYVGINRSPAVELDVQRVSTSYPLRISAEDGSARTMVFADSAGSPSRVNWLAGAQYNTDNGWELTPSTANGGYTFTNRVLTAYANGNLTVNENGIDADFRAESDINANALFLDAGTDV